MGLIIAIHIAICVFMVVIILLQPGKSDSGIGFGSSSQSIFGSRGAGNFLTKTTSVCATVFLLTSFLMSFPKCTGKHEEDVGGADPVAASPSPSVSPADSAAPEPVAPSAKSLDKGKAPRATSPAKNPSGSASTGKAKGEEPKK